MEGRFGPELWEKEEIQEMWKETTRGWVGILWKVGVNEKNK